MSKKCNDTFNFLVDDIEQFKVGAIPRDYLDELYFFMRPQSELIKEAVVKHLCDGLSQAEVSRSLGVPQGNIARHVKRLEIINTQIFNLKKFFI